MTFPPIIIIMVFVSIVGPGMWNLIFILGILSWPGVCRLVRAEFLALREMEYVEASIALGASPYRVMFRHILPNTMAPILVNGSFGTAAAILTESGLSFLGLGIPPPTASFGNMLNNARVISVLESQPWIWLPPGIMIVLSVLAINFIGDGLRDAFGSQEPRVRGREGIRRNVRCPAGERR